MVCMDTPSGDPKNRFWGTPLGGPPGGSGSVQTPKMVDFGPYTLYTGQSHEIDPKTSIFTLPIGFEKGKTAKNHVFVRVFDVFFDSSRVVYTELHSNGSIKNGHFGP